MKQERAHLIASEIKSKNPILILDRNGILGTYLANKLKEQFLVVLVSGRTLSFHKNIIHIPYTGKIPSIPDNRYSHFFVFHTGEEDELSIFSAVCKKADMTNGKVFFLTDLFYSSSKLFEKLSAHVYRNICVIIYGEVFDGGVKIINTMNYLIHAAKVRRKIVLPNEGLGKLYPVFIDDLIASIIAVSFSTEKPGKHIFAFPKVPFTELSVARILQRLDPDLKIDFTNRSTKTSNFFIPERGEYVFGAYDLTNGLKKAMSQKAEVGISSLEKIPLRRQRNFLDFRTIWYILLAAILLPVLFAVIATVLGIAFAKASIKTAESGNFQRAGTFAQFSEGSFQTAGAISASYFPLAIFSGSTQSQITKELESAKDASGIERDIFGSFNTFSEIYNSQSKNPKGDFLNALTVTKNSLIRLEEMRAQHELPKEITDKLDSMSFLLSGLENTIDSYPQILGFSAPKKYLILFQNNMELRPGGGFIGSYATVSVDKGQFGKIAISDVYDADGKLRVHIEPPFGLKRYGGVTHWFLRDTNFDVSTLTNAAASASLLKQETGDSVDGVISIDTDFIKNLLATTGPVDVTDYNEKVTADNFYLLTQKHAEDNFFPGSTQKKDFLRSLLQALLAKMSQKNGVSYASLVNQIEKSIIEKHLYVVFADQSIQRAFSVNNLSSAVLDDREKENNTTDDYFGVVDANIGANKANYFLTRTISQTVTISDSGAVSARADITYTNTSTSQNRFGGDYRDYVRFLLPEGSDLQSVQIDGADNGIIPAITDPSQYQASGFVPPKELEVETGQVNRKELVAFFIAVPMGGVKKVTINYTIPQGIDTSSSVFSYDLRLYKQPGTDQDPYTLTLNYPTKFMPIDLSHAVVDLGGKVSYETNLNTDKDINIKFSQK